MPRLSLRADAGVGAVAIAPSSRDAVLAGRSGLYVVDLQDPFALPRWLPLRSVWEVAAIQWCPHAQRPTCLVSSSNQKVLVWNLALPSDRAVEHVLHGHRRAVTDVDFSPHHPDFIATASIDTSVKIWDLRRLNRAALTFADFHAGTIQTRWSPTDEHQVASAHDNRFVLWDKRRANRPVATVKAHQGECNGLQFLANGRIMTCSTDRTVKIWNTDNLLRSDGLDDFAETTIEAGFPVWRAVPTPYELGALVVPLRGGDNCVSLINLARQTGIKQLSEVKVGGDEFAHPDNVANALFMRSDQSSSHYDVVTWCHDGHLRQWNGGVLQELPHASSAAGCKDDPPPPIPADRRTFNTDDFDHLANGAHFSHGMFELPLTNRPGKDEAHAIGHLDWIAGVKLDQKNDEEKQKYGYAGAARKDVASSSKHLSQEILAMSSHFPKVSFDDIDIGAGICDFSISGPWGLNNNVVPLKLNLTVPENYPNQAISYTIVDGSELREGAAEHILQSLTDIASLLSRHGVHALECSIRFLVGDPVSLEDYLAAEGPQNSELASSSGSENAKTSEDSQTEAPSGESGADESDLFEAGSSEDSKAYSISEDEDGSASDFTSDNNFEEVDRSSHRKDTKRDDIIDSTPVPRNCGAMWSPTGKLICFFNHKPAGKDKGPLPLDKVFADDARSDDSNAPFMSDSDDFELEVPHSVLRTTANWSIAAAQLASNPATLGGHSGTNAGSNTLVSTKFLSHPADTHNSGRNRSRTMTSLTSDDRSVTPRQPGGSAFTHTVMIKNMLHLWPSRPDVAAEYTVCMSGDPLHAVEHNAKVAAKYGLYEDESIWRILRTYIKVEEAECMDAYSAITSEEYKFDWCGGSVGLRSFMPQMADRLERKGKIQLLACMSLVFSSLRVRRAFLRRLREEMNPMNLPLTIMEPDVESVFQINSNGSLNLVADRRRDALDLGSRDSTPTDRAESVHTHSDASVIDPDNPGGSHFYDGGHAFSDTLGPPPISRHHSAHLPEAHSPHVGEAPFVGVKISSDMFSFDDQPSSYVAVRNGTNAERDFSEWLPRLIQWRKKYASLLQIWGLNIKRAEIVKLNPYDMLIIAKRHEIRKDNNHEELIDIEVTGNAPCALCNMPITRLFEYCARCSHAMHRECAQQWWENERECPAACGCDCKSHVSN